MLSLLSQLLQSEPEADARATYVETLAWVAPGLVVAVPESLMLALLARVTHCVQLEAQAAPALRRCLHMTRGAMILYRYPQPFTGLKEVEAVKRLALEAGDSGMALAIDAAASEFFSIELGDREGAQRRLLDLEPKLLQSGEGLHRTLWRHLLA
jgi:hypothetical protein